MYHSFLIQSSVDGYLGCFQILAIINCAAINAPLIPYPQFSSKYSQLFWYSLYCSWQKQCLNQESPGECGQGKRRWQSMTHPEHDVQGDLPKDYISSVDTRCAFQMSVTVVIALPLEFGR